MTRTPETNHKLPRPDRAPDASPEVSLTVERAPGLLRRGPPHRRPTTRRCDPRRLFRPNSTARESPDKRPDLGGPAYFRAASPAKRGRGTRRPDVGRLCPTARPSAVTSVSDRAATRKHGCLKQVQIGRYAGRTRRSSPRRGTVIKRCMRSSLAVSSCPLSASSTGAPRVRGAESFRRARRPLDQPEAARPPGTASRPRKGLPNGGESCASPRIMPMKHKNNGRSQSNKQS